MDKIFSIDITNYILFSSLLFSIGAFGVYVNRKSIINILMSVELMLLAVNVNFVSFSYYLQNMEGQIMTLLVLTVAAAEVAIGLAILILYFRNCDSIDVDDIARLNG